MNSVIAPKFLQKTPEIEKMIADFGSNDNIIVKGKRNIIKKDTLGNLPVTIKAFKVPNAINSIAYRFFRKSKAQRSYEYANILLGKNIGTPKPVAYFENKTASGFKESYYICEYLNYDFMFRDITKGYPDYENIMKQFVAFCYELHEKGIEFKDHSPGNTLIKKEAEGKYSFYLVDLNRMDFHTSMSFEQRMENLKRLTPEKEEVLLMSREYAKLYNKDADEVFNMLWDKTSNFQKKFWRKKRIKGRLKSIKKLF